MSPIDDLSGPRSTGSSVRGVGEGHERWRPRRGHVDARRRGRTSRPPRLPRSRTGCPVVRHFHPCVSRQDQCHGPPCRAAAPQRSAGIRLRRCAAVGCRGAAVRAHERGAVLVVSSDTRNGLATSTDESTGGDAGAAIVVGDDGQDGAVIAEWIGSVRAPSPVRAPCPATPLKPHQQP